SVRSFASPVCLSFQLSEVARVTLATAPPDGRYRVSGSLPRLPMRMTLLTPRAMMFPRMILLRPRRRRGPELYRKTQPHDRESRGRRERRRRTVMLHRPAAETAADRLAEELRGRIHAHRGALVLDRRSPRHQRRQQPFEQVERDEEQG